MTWLVSLLLVVIAVVVTTVVGYNWTQTHYYVGNDRGYVAIYRGVQQDIGPIRLSSVYQKTSISIARLPAFNRSQVQATISAGNLTLAEAIVDRLANASN